MKVLFTTANKGNLGIMGNSSLFASLLENKCETAIKAGTGPRNHQLQDDLEALSGGQTHTHT